MKPIYKITYGGWYQRTTLHLSEIYDLFVRGHSNLHLDKKKLHDFHKHFKFETVTREAGYLEYVKTTSKNGIECRYYEDGLYILETEATDSIATAKKKLEKYFEEILNPATGYIFSLGAPTPKILANIKTIHPVVVSVTDDNPETFKPDEKEFGDIYSTISSKDIVVHKTHNYIFIVSKHSVKSTVAELAEMQIFFESLKIN